MRILFVPICSFIIGMNIGYDLSHKNDNSFISAIINCNGKKIATNSLSFMKFNQNYTKGIKLSDCEWRIVR